MTKKNHSITPAREIAFNILLDVELGKFASDLLAEHTAGIDSRDAGLATSITLGVLRFRGQIDWIIQSLTGKATSKLDSEVLQALRIGIYQLRYMDRVPDHAAVGQSVEIVKRSGKRSASGLVNAVLRKARSFEPKWPNRATELSCPEWLLRRWPDGEAIARAALEIPLRYAHIPDGVSVPEGAAATDVPGCYLLPADVDWPRLQDIGSQAVPLLLEARDGDVILDLCAAPGNKTSQLRESGASVIACDISSMRLSGVPEPRVLLDAREPLPLGAVFDRILVDAPCSGTGTIAHNPEIKWRLVEADIEKHQLRQCAILRNALAVLKPGGTLVYSTCSLERQENEDVVAAVAPDRIKKTVRRTPGKDPGDGFFAAVLM